MEPALNAEKTRLLAERDDLKSPLRSSSMTEAQRDAELTQLNGKLYTVVKADGRRCARRWRTGRRERLCSSSSPRLCPDHRVSLSALLGQVVAIDPARYGVVSDGIPEVTAVADDLHPIST